MASEALAKLNVNLKDLMEIFAGEPLLDTYFESNRPDLLIELCAGYGRCKPFIDHDNLATLMRNCYYSHYDFLIIERKNLKKRLNILLADQKSDKEVVNKVQNSLADLEDRISRCFEACLRSKHVASIPIKHFTGDKTFNPLGNPQFDHMAHAVENTLKKGYVVLVDKEEKKSHYFKKEEYRKYLSLYSDFPKAP